MRVHFHIQMFWSVHFLKALLRACTINKDYLRTQVQQVCLLTSRQHAFESFVISK